MGDIKRIGLRMPIGTYTKLDEMSKRYGVPVASLVNFIVAQWIDGQKRYVGPVKEVNSDNGKGC